MRLSVLIPSRNEPYLIKTIEDVFAKAKGEIEAVAVLEGYWPDNWKETVAKYPNLHTIHHGEPKGLRPSVNAAAGSAISRGAKYLLKLDAHVMVDEGFDIKLLADIQPNWIVVPRRKRLDPVTWTLTDTHKIDIDYHYLSFPDDPADFGGPGLNGKVWEARARERKDKPEYDLDWEMSSQGSAWAMSAKYFEELELMDAENYGTFWNEAQEWANKCWLSGGQVMVNKKTWYAHWHKGKAGRGYHLNEKLLKQGRNYTMKWLHNEAWPKQTLPFKSLIERFWPVPGWPENWEEAVYGGKPTRMHLVAGSDGIYKKDALMPGINDSTLRIHQAHYGIGSLEDIDVAKRLQSLIVNDSLDIVVDNSTLTPNQNPFRGKRKQLTVTYSYDDRESTTVTRNEKEWLIIGQAGRQMLKGDDEEKVRQLESRLRLGDDHPAVLKLQPLSATALNDFLIRRFQIPDRRLRGPMPIELRDFHRDDLAKLFAELGFNRGAEIGVAEGVYSEILLKANPECELLLVDPWAAYDGNAQNKIKEKHLYAFERTRQKVQGYKGAKMVSAYSMDAVRDVPDASLDFCYLDANHSYPFIMEDLIGWSRKVRAGGIIALDDIYRLDEKRWGAGPMDAIYDYARAMRISPWWLIAAHKSVDAFFVKP